MKKRLISLLMSIVLCVALPGCNAADTAQVIDDTLGSMEELQKAIENFEMPDQNFKVDSNEVTEEDLADVTDEVVVTEHDGLTGIELVKSLNEKGAYPAEIDLSLIFANEEEFDKECDAILVIAQDLSDKYKGTLSNKEAIYSYYEDLVSSGLQDRINRMSVFCELGASLNIVDEYYASLNAKKSKLVLDINNILAFEKAEICNIPVEERVEIFDAPEFASIKYALRDYADAKSVYFNENENVIINTLTSSYGNAYNTYRILAEKEVVTPVITMPNGEQTELNNGVYLEIKNGDYDHEFLKLVDDAMGRKYEYNINSFTSLLEGSMKEKYQIAKLNGFDTVLDYTLNTDDVDKVIFNNCILSCRNMLPELQRYVSLQKKGRKIEDKITSIEFRKGLAQYNSEVSYDDSVQIAEEALLTLGDEYVMNFDRLFREGHADIYPGTNKVSSSFEIGTHVKEELPYIVISYNGYADDVSNLAHEAGHGVYDYLSGNNENLNSLNNAPTIFTQEIASTTNQFLVYRYLYDNAKDDEEKLFYLEKVITLIESAAMLQILCTEFENYCYEKIEAGEGLDANDLCLKWASLYQEYYGDDYEISAGTGYKWVSIPHMYLGYYMYKYASSITYAGIISSKILNGDEKIVENYLNMLSLGSSLAPADLIKVVGIDPSDAIIYDEFNNMFKTYVDEYEELLISTGRIEG